MVDEVEAAEEEQYVLSSATIRAIRLQVEQMPKGEPGECEACGDYFSRLVDGLCGFCRDGRTR